MTLYPIDEGLFHDGQMRLAALEGEEMMGCVDLYNYDPVNRRAAVGIVVQPERRHQGVGTQMLEVLVGFCQQSLHLHQLYCDVAATNPASLHLFDKAGYVRCGTMRDWVASNNGGFVDTVRFQYLIPAKH